MAAMVQQANLGPPASKYHKEDPQLPAPSQIDDSRQPQHSHATHQPLQLQHPRSAGILQHQKQPPKSPHQSETSIPQPPYPSPHVIGNGIHLQRQSPYGAPAQEPYYSSHPGTYTATSSSGHYPSSEAPDLMAATAQMQRPYPPIYHTPQSNSPASVASPQGHDPHGRSLYGQPPQMASGMYGYPQFPPMNPVHTTPYAPHPSQQHAHLTSQPLLVGHQGTPGQLQHQHQQTQQHPGGVTSSPRMKFDPTPQHPPSSQRTPLNQSHQQPPVSGGTVHSGTSGSNTSAAPGPIPATTPLVVRQDGNGVQWIAFEYSRDRVKMEYTIRCDVENINIENLSQEFKTENCVYPRACCSKEQYRGNRLVYETECNAVGWALAELNSCLRGKRGLIQRAVDSWRNSNQDPRLRSRRVRRMAKINNRKAVAAQHANQLTGPPPAGVPGSTALATTGSLSMGGPQLHHHHAHPAESGTTQSGEDVSGNPEYSNGTHRPSAPPNTYAQPGPSPADIRPGHMFHGYPSYPNPASSHSQTGPSMPPPLRDTGLDHLGRHSTVATSHSRSESDDHSPDNTALFGDLPEGRRRKFILVEDPQRNCRVRVKVMLDQVDMKEIPDSYRKSNSVFPRTYFPVQSPFGRGNRGDRFVDDDAGGNHEDNGDDAEATVGRTLVPVPTLDGEANLAVPKIARGKRNKEVMLNDLGYRMSWGQSRVFSGRTLFLQRALDAYRNKMRSTMITATQELTSVAPHFETRVGKRKWLERSKQPRAGVSASGRGTPAVTTISSARDAEEVEG
ncbi:ribosomal protein L24E [Blastomyces dermatitidis ATCC 18188]|uniref:Ribosomal protein L24E n=1 Tax=Ajellomyces dermatitidis (strain ATCC 18188 / CBS 674.68) TaxID=653446 RepID=F2TEF9_AJEDA|nr:ribosomal protein L24E [Blastomyces dermatitidis ATCC 18188]